MERGDMIYGMLATWGIEQLEIHLVSWVCVWRRDVIFVTKAREKGGKGTRCCITRVFEWI